MIYFCSDMHLSHHNVLKFDPFRNFSSMQEHDSFLLKELQSLSSKDTAYFLGDLVWKMDKETEELMKKELAKVKAKMYWIKGNHDYPKIVDTYKHLFLEVCDYKEIKYEGHKFILSHYPMMSWNGMYRNAIHLHGHTHKQAFFIEGDRYDISYNGICFLWDIDWFLNGYAKQVEEMIYNSLLDIQLKDI